MGESIEEFKSFLDSPELIQRSKMIDEILANLNHFPIDYKLDIIFSWIDKETIERMHETICKEKY